MKESKFIELLNLYVDHQISPAEAELLEAEVKSNPARRRVYREYCEIQKGCSVLAETFRTEAPSSVPNLVEFKPVRRFPVGVVATFGSLAAVAACVAVVFLSRSHLSMPASISNPVAQQTIAPATLVAATPVVRPALQPAIGPKALTLRAQNPELAETNADQAAFAEWMGRVQLVSLPGVSADDLRFDAHATPQPDIRSYRATRSFQGQAEATAAAFTFQK